MNEQNTLKLRCISAILEYMASSDALDIVYTKEALFMIAEELYCIIDNCGRTLLH